jgi:TPR repeat protein
VRRVIAALFSLVVTTALAGDLEDGWTAYERQDYATALAKWRSAGQQGDRNAHTLIGLMYWEGTGVAKDLSVADVGVPETRLFLDTTVIGGRARLMTLHGLGRLRGLRLKGTIWL